MKIWYQSNALKPSVAYAAVRSKGGGFVVIDMLLSVAPIVVFCVCSIFCCSLHCVLSAIILIGKKELIALLHFFFFASCDCYLQCVIVVFPDPTQLLFLCSCHIIKMTIFDGNSKFSTRPNDIVYWFEQVNYINCYLLYL